LFSPFQTNLDDCSINEIENKIAELSRKYHQANNPALQDQIATFIDIYKVELHSRIAKETLKNQQQNNENGDDSLDNLINVS